MHAVPQWLCIRCQVELVALGSQFLTDGSGSRQCQCFPVVMQRAGLKMLISKYVCGARTLPRCLFCRNKVATCKLQGISESSVSW